MTSKGRYFSKPMPHGQIPGAFFGSYGLPGEPGQVVMGLDGRRLVFASEDMAELVGYRRLVKRLNEKLSEPPKPPRQKTERRKSELDRVFERFDR